VQQFSFNSKHCKRKMTSELRVYGTVLKVAQEAARYVSGRELDVMFWCHLTAIQGNDM